MTKKLMLLCFVVLFLLVLNSCMPTFAYITDESSYEASEILNDVPSLEEEMTVLEEEEDELIDEEDHLPEQVEALTDEWPERVAFLTFDDGPSGNTASLLDILYQENVPATFFVLGDSILERPNSIALMERIMAEGHYIGLHSMTHDFATLYTGYGASDRFVAEMRQLQELIAEAVGQHTFLCRAPYGMISGFRPDSGHAEAVAAAGLKCIDWNVDPRDWDAANSAEVVVQYVINQTTALNFPPEIVIVLHEEIQTVGALPAIIAFLRENGYVFKAYQPGHEFIYQQHRY